VVGEGALRDLREWFPKVEEIIKPYLSTPISHHFYTLETTLFEYSEQAVAA
jgi:hypothetical protein